MTQAKMVGVDPATGGEVEAPFEVLEKSGVGFDPTTQHLDLSQAEKRRVTALMLAINGYRELIIKEAAYLHEAADLARRDEGPKLGAATIDGMVEAAIKFDNFIAGVKPDAEVKPS
jgi:hypothetical protein